MPKILPALTAVFAALALGGAVQAEPPKGWLLSGSTPQNYDTGLEAHGAGKAAFIRRKSGPPRAPRDFGTLMQYIEAKPYLGKRLRLSASLRAEGAERAQMWMRVEGGDRVVAFDNMSDRPLIGTTEWKRYEIVLDVPADGTHVAYGFFLNGQGKVSADDFRIEVVSPEVPTTGGTFQGTPRNLGFEESRLGNAAGIGCSDAIGNA